MSKREVSRARSLRVATGDSKELVAELRQLIARRRERTAQAVNVGLTLLYWEVGNRIKREILKEKRAE
ncbi:MAG: DUF1016 domain-containing protein [Deltaproteobacteria bacterium]|nr:DUF1016 domain-containing protein [Deltaproteobacteria bacterium]MBM4296714.1 DUF1016 domain-containing protein [Deltaproteobacteria bacterium]